MYHKIVNIVGFDPTDQVLNLVGSTVLLTNIIVEALQPNWLTICIGISFIGDNMSSLTVAEEVRVYGRFTTLTVSAGRVLAYRLQLC